MTIRFGIQNIRDHNGTLGTVNKVLGITQVGGNPKLTWVDGSHLGSGGPGGTTHTTIEPFNISLSTKGTSSDDETGTYIHSSSFFANSIEYSSLKLYASEINVTTGDKIHIYISTLTESVEQQFKLYYEYTFSQTINPGDNVGYEINIDLPSSSFLYPLIIGNKYNLGIHKNINSSGGSKLHLVTHPHDQALNGLNYLYNYDSNGPYGIDITNIPDDTIKQEHFRFFWYRLSNTSSSSSQESFNISQSTLQDNDSTQFYTYSSFIAEKDNYTKIKLYLNQKSYIHSNDNKIHVRIIDNTTAQTEYMSGSVGITQDNVDNIITINLTQTLGSPAITRGNKYLLGIYKEIPTPYDDSYNPAIGAKVRLYTYPSTNPLNGLFKLTEPNDPYTNVPITTGTGGNYSNVKLYWYKLE